MSYPIINNIIAGLPRRAYRKGIGAYEGVVAHATADYNADDEEEVKYFINNWQQRQAFVHYFVDWDSIRQTADMDYIGWGAGYVANQRYVHVELCQTRDPAKFAESYKRYVWLLAWILRRKNLGVFELGTFWSHRLVSENLGDTDHRDPDAYLESHGKSWAVLVQDVKNEYIKQTGGETKNMFHVEKIKRDTITNSAIIRANGTGETLEQMYARLPDPKPKYLVNGGYFNMTDGWTLSALKIDGKIIRDVSAVSYGYVLAGTGNTIKIHTMGDKSFLEVSDPYEWAIEMPLFAPEVMGVPAAALGAHERSAIGYDVENSEWVLGATDEGDLLYCHDLEPALGVSSGILLDGGGSTNMLKDGECVNEQSYRRPVANAIAIWAAEVPEHADSDVVTWGDLRELGLI